MLLGRGQVSILTPPSPSWTETGNYTCEFCGKQYKYYTPYQEHVALHAPISEYLFQWEMGHHEVGEEASLWPGDWCNLGRPDCRDWTAPLKPAGSESSRDGLEAWCIKRVSITCPSPTVACPQLPLNTSKPGAS